MTEMPLEADGRLVEIYNRALSARIPCAWYTRGITSSMLKLRLPDGDSGLVVDVRPENAERFARVPFEDIVLLGNYFAHWNRERKEIVAGIKGRGILHQFSSIPGFIPSGSKNDEPEGEVDEDLLDKFGLLDKSDEMRQLNQLTGGRARGQIPVKNSNKDLEITLQIPASNDLFFCGDTTMVSASLRVRGVDLSDIREATKFLFDLSHTIFFDLDMNYSITLQLCMRTDIPSFRTEPRKATPEDPPEFPSYRFPRDAIALYMHARTINSAPLTEYLTYYQVIEHCMTALSRPNVIRKLRERLSDPAFDLDDDTALSELLLQPNRGGQSNMPEREQLRTALRVCVTAENIKDLLRSDESLERFVSDAGNPLASHLIATNNQATDLPRQLADRIYDLRCRIVHAKGNAYDEAGSPLLPFNADANLLRHDLSLVKFAAQQVLLAAAIPMEV